MSTFVLYFNYLSLSVLVINSIIYPIASLKIKNLSFSIICYYLIYMLSIEIMLKYGEIIGLGSNLFFSHNFFIGQFLIASGFFYTTIRNRLVKKMIAGITLLIVIGLFIHYYLDISEYFNMNTNEAGATSIPLMIYCIIFFTEQFTTSNREFVYFVSGFFSYLCSGLIFFFLRDAIATFGTVAWILSIFSYAVFMILIFVEWYKNFRKPKVVW